MLMLPKMNKGIKQAMTKLEKAGKVVVAAALISGVSAIAIPTNEVQAEGFSQGAMVLAPAFQANGDIAGHYSHSSHESHASHASHASHYSSRY